VPVQCSDTANQPRDPDRSEDEFDLELFEVRVFDGEESDLERSAARPEDESDLERSAARP